MPDTKKTTALEEGHTVSVPLNPDCLFRYADPYQNIFTLKKRDDKFYIWKISRNKHSTNVSSESFDDISAAIKELRAGIDYTFEVIKNKELKETADGEPYNAYCVFILKTHDGEELAFVRTTRGENIIRDVNGDELRIYDDVSAAIDVLKTKIEESFDFIEREIEGE